MCFLDGCWKDPEDFTDNARRLVGTGGLTMERPMLDFLTLHSENDAIVILEKDHAKVKSLFGAFEKATNPKEKKKIADQVIKELKIHAAIEEDIFYKAVRTKVGGKIMNEADEEHHIAKVLIAELEQMKGTEDHFDAKFKVLSENVRHHIREEESDMLPKAREISMDFEKLGKSLMAEKQKLMKSGVPLFAEEQLVRKSRGRADSSAQKANPSRRSAKAHVKKGAHRKSTEGRQRAK